MTSKAAKRRASRRRMAGISLAGEPKAEQPKRQPDGRIRPEDVRKVAFEARCRQSTDLMPQKAVAAEAKALQAAMAMEDPKAKREAVCAISKRVEDMRMRAANEPKLADSVGRMILTEPEPKRPDLWNAAQHARQTQLAYDRAIGSPNRHAQVARILAPVTAFEADASSPAPDFRTDDERYRQAIAAQMRVEGWIGHTDKAAMSAFKQAVINDPDGRIRDWDGVRACLQCIAEGLKGEAVKARVR